MKVQMKRPEAGKRKKIENYENSTRNALEMTRNSLDSSFRIVNQKVMELGQETSVRSYALGALGKDGEAVLTTQTLSSSEIDSFIKGLEDSEDGLSCFLQPVHSFR